MKKILAPMLNVAVMQQHKTTSTDLPSEFKLGLTIKAAAAYEELLAQTAAKRSR
jgi:hypothetical protein